jgi:hypothetical protein
MRSTAVPGYSWSTIGIDDDASVPEEEFNLDDGNDDLSTPLGLRISPVADTTNDDVLLLLLPIDAAAAAKLENRVLANVVANEKTTGDKKRISRDQRDRNNCCGCCKFFCYFGNKSIFPSFRFKSIAEEFPVDDYGLARKREFEKRLFIV